MHTLERPLLGTDLADMVERTIHYNELARMDLSKAQAYWAFVLASYREQGYESAWIEELSWQADEIVAKKERDLGTL